MQTNFLKILKDVDKRLRTLEQNQELRNISIPADGKIIVPSYTADPAGANSTNGQVYYNTTTNKFRGYENGAWADLI